MREKIPSSPTPPFSTSPKEPLAKDFVTFVSIGVMTTGSFSPLPIAENTPRSAKFSAETNDGLLNTSILEAFVRVHITRK